MRWSELEKRSLRQYARDAIAADHARIASITPPTRQELHDIIEPYAHSIIKRGFSTEEQDERLEAIVRWMEDRCRAYIDGRTAGTAPVVPEVVQQALDIALDLAMAEADSVHKIYAGYKQHRHEAVDRDVETIKRAIDAVNPAAPSPLNSGKEEAHD
jgi:hypothetical protein